jgi:uncharacterized protein (UPF0305 family)
MATNGNKKLAKTSNIFYCEVCDYNASKKYNLELHLNTKKHKNRCLATNDNKKLAKTSKNILQCQVCEKEFNDRSGLWRHSKKCCNSETLDKNDLLIQLLKQNRELQQSLIDLSKEKTITNNTHTNSHNKTFNLNFYLNETCKDALNIREFVSSIKLNLEDLETTGRKGYIEGISNIILKNLKGLEQYKRPIHCSDLKREVMYIKDENTWIKEGEEKPILTNAIKVIANENIKQIKEWKEQNPECTDSDSKKNNLYLRIVSNSMNGTSTQESNKNMSKIISNVAKETLIQKDP